MKRVGLLLVAGLLCCGCSKGGDGQSVEMPDKLSPPSGEPAGAVASIQATGPMPSTRAMAIVNSGIANIHPRNTLVNFTGKHVGDNPDPREGNFQEFSGQIAVDEEAREVRSIAFEIQTDSLHTEVDQLTDHLKSPDFLDVRQHPTITFKSTSIEDQDGASATVTGDLTLMGVTKEIDFPVTLDIAPGGVMLVAEFSIDRTEFGMEGMTERVSKDVNLRVAVGESTRPTLPAAAMGGGAGGGGGGGGGRGGFDPAAFFKERDADGDGKLSGDELTDRMRESLEETDTDKDGAVSLEELQARMAARRGGGGGRGGRAGGADAEKEKQ